MKKLEQESLLADRASVTSLLESMSENDFVGRLSFSSRLAEIDRRLAELADMSEPLGTVALMFTGDPVHGSRSIDAEFAGRAMRSFQELITKRIAVDELGALPVRGPLPMRSPTTLAIKDVVRGSVGFILEESGPYVPLLDTAVKKAIDEITLVIQKTASEDVAIFEEAVETLDPRVLKSLKEFFQTLDEGKATIRIVEDERDLSLDAVSVHRGRERVDKIDIKLLENDILVGELLGLLPEARQFEMRLQGGELIKGKVASKYAETYLELIEAQDQPPIVGRTWRVRMQIREVRERNKPMRKLYTLVGILDHIPLQE